MNVHSHFKYTAGNFITEFVVDGPDTWDLVSPEYFGKFEIEDTGVYYSTRNERYLGHLFYARFPELIDGLCPCSFGKHPWTLANWRLTGLGPLGPAVLQRSMSQLTSILQSETFSVTAYALASETALMYLATRWHDGLPHLLEAGFPPGFAMQEALREDDFQALKIASGFRGWTPGCVLPFAPLSSDPVQQYLVDAVRKQRDELLHLCYEHLSLAELTELELPGLVPLDAKVALAGEMLRAKGIRIENQTYNGPVYESIKIWRLGEPARIVSLLDKLYAAGFRDIDGSGAFTNTLWRRIKHILEERRPALAILGWLAATTTSPLRSLVKKWPSAIFDLAFAYGEIFEINKSIGQVTTLLQTLTASCDATQRDSCACFCSRGGCLPSRLFLTRKLSREACYYLDADVHWKYRGCRDNRDRMLGMWCELCSLNDKWTSFYLEDSVRVEIFDRLGMIHTCCRVADAYDFSRGLGDLEAWCASDEERRQVQYEDAELNEQLELIMKAYGGYTQRFVASTSSSKDLLRGWWCMLGEILPQVHETEGSEEGGTDEEWDTDDVPDPESCDRGAAIQREALVRLGYGDFDFLEVIRRHFRDYLEEEDELGSVGEDGEQATLADDQLLRQDGSIASRLASFKPEDDRPGAKRRNSC